MVSKEAIPRQTAIRGVINESSILATSYFGVDTLATILDKDFREAAINILAIIAIQTIRPVATALARTSK